MAPAGEAGLTFYGAIDTFKKKVLEDPRRSDAWKRILTQRVERLKEVMTDRLMSVIRYDELVSVVNFYAALPKGKNGKRISVDTALNYITTARSFFSWANRSDRWLAPRHFDDLFDIDRRKLERNSDQINTGQVKVFSVAELTAVWKYIGTIQPSLRNRRRLLCLLALNTGMTQHELAQLRKTEVNLKTGVIERKRYKTGVWARWTLWPETLKLLEDQIDRTGSELALLTDEGTPLVQYRADRDKTDSVGLAWKRMMKSVRKNEKWVRPLGFKFLRKTGSDLVRKAGGVEMAEAFLSHAERSVSRVYNNRDFEKLAGCLVQVRRMLHSMFVG